MITRSRAALKTKLARLTSPVSGKVRLACTEWAAELLEGLIVTIFIVILSAIAVAVALVLGLKNMMVGGSGQVSQKLMRLRVMLQAVAVFVIMAVLWWTSGSGS